MLTLVLKHTVTCTLWQFLIILRLAGQYSDAALAVSAAIALHRTSVVLYTVKLLWKFVTRSHFSFAVLIHYLST